MNLLYKSSLFLYFLVIRLASFFNEKAALFARGRKNWRDKLRKQVTPGARYIWIHCASLGEFEQGRPVIEEIKKRYPELKIALTFFSPSGYEIRKNYPLADVILYLPYDSIKNARDFLQILNPEKVFFVKYEYWRWFITETKKRKIPLYLISAIFRENQLFFRDTIPGRWYRQMLFQFDHLFIQDEESAKLLTSIEFQNYTIAGDTRFDRVAAIAAAAKEIEKVDKFRGNKKLIVAGSTWKPDEELLTEFINQTKGVKMIFAPHEVTPENLQRLEGLLQKPAARFSKANADEIEKFDILIIDSIGMLSSLYRYGQVAYIGGGFGVGIHNILEAATYGLPVVFGPAHKKFREAVELIKAGGAFPVKDYGELEAALYSLLRNDRLLSEASETCLKFVRDNTGATDIILKNVFQEMQNHPAN